MVVAEDLYLDVARVDQAFLDQHAGIAKSLVGFSLRARQRLGKLRRRIDAAHAFAAAAGSGFQQHRVTNEIGLALQQRGVLILAVIARHQRHPGGFHQALGRTLRAHRHDCLRRRADKHHTTLGAELGKARVFREEPVARVDGLRAGGECRLDDALATQVGIARRGAADVHRLIGHADMQRVAIRVGVHRHRADAEAAGRADHAAGDFTAVGDKDLVEHEKSPRRIRVVS